MWRTSPGWHLCLVLLHMATPPKGASGSEVAWLPSHSPAARGAGKGGAGGSGCQEVPSHLSTTGHGHAQLAGRVGVLCRF